MCYFHLYEAEYVVHVHTESLRVALARPRRHPNADQHARSLFNSDAFLRFRPFVLRNNAVRVHSRPELGMLRMTNTGNEACDQ